MIKKYNILFFIFILIAFGALNLIFHDHRKFSQAENRELASFPKFSVESLKKGTYFKGIEDYYTDHFMFRDSFIKLNHAISSLKGIKDNGVEIVTVDNGNQLGEANTGTGPKTDDGAIGNDEQNENNNDPLQKNTIDDNAQEDLDDTDSEDNSKDNAPQVQGQNGFEKADVKIDDAKGAITRKRNILVQNGTGYEIFGYSKRSCKIYADAINSFANKLPEGVKVYSLVAPTHTEFIQNAKYRKLNQSESDAINTIYSDLNSNIYRVDALNSILPHYKEYVYFRTDHHWTARGAYYAYEAFCKTAGLDPVPLDSFKVKKFPKFLGTLYNDTLSQSMAKNPDTVEVFMPNVKSTFKIYLSPKKVLNWRVINEAYASPKNRNKYMVFISGDQPLSVIKTEADSDKKLLIFKDSYANAFIPFLMNHYKEIAIIDPRHYKGDAVEYAKKHRFDDVMFLNSAAVVAGNTGFAKNIMRITK